MVLTANAGEFSPAFTVFGLACSRRAALGSHSACFGTLVQLMCCVRVSFCLFSDTCAVGARADYAQAGRRATYLARFTAIRQESKTSRKVLPQDSTRSNHPGQAKTELLVLFQKE